MKPRKGQEFNFDTKDEWAAEIIKEHNENLDQAVNYALSQPQDLRDPAMTLLCVKFDDLNSKQQESLFYYICNNTTCDVTIGCLVMIFELEADEEQNIISAIERIAKQDDDPSFMMYLFIEDPFQHYMKANKKTIKRLARFIKNPYWAKKLVESDEKNILPLKVKNKLLWRYWLATGIIWIMRIVSTIVLCLVLWKFGWYYILLFFGVALLLFTTIMLLSTKSNDLCEKGIRAFWRRD